MLNQTFQMLDSLKEKSDKKIGDLNFDLSTAKAMVDQSLIRKNEVEERLKIEIERLEAIKEARIIIAGVSRRIYNMRRRLLARIERSKGENITIIQKRLLDTEIEKLKKLICLICNHPFVFHKKGYSGTPSEDYENGYPSERYCVVCGLEEMAKDFRQNGRVDTIGTVFETLKESDNRLIKREPCRSYPLCLSHVDIWVPLGAVIKPFEESVVRALNS